MIGTLLVLAGTILGIVGTLINNLRRMHHLAMMVWAVSNPLLMIWLFGRLVGWWNGDLGLVALLCVHIVYTTSNWYGLVRK